MDHLGYFLCQADPDMWMRKSKRSNCEDYYEYYLLYADNFFMMNDDPKASLDRIGKYFTLKED